MAGEGGTGSQLNVCAAVDQMRSFAHKPPERKLRASLRMTIAAVSVLRMMAGHPEPVPRIPRASRTPDIAGRFSLMSYFC
jgi:hypothetical protein